MEDILFTAKETAKLLKTDEPTVRRLINKRLLKALKLGRLKIRKAEIDRFLEWAEGKDLSNLDNVTDLDYREREGLKCAR